MIRIINNERLLVEMEHDVDVTLSLIVVDAHCSGCGQLWLDGQVRVETDDGHVKLLCASCLSGIARFALAVESPRDDREHRLRVLRHLTRDSAIGAPMRRKKVRVRA